MAEEVIFRILSQIGERQKTAETNDPCIPQESQISTLVWRGQVLGWGSYVPVLGFGFRLMKMGA